MMPSAQCSIEPNVAPSNGDLLLGIAAVPHRFLVPRVAERVDVGRGHAVIEDAVVVGGEAALAARQRLHVVVRGEAIVDPRLLGKGRLSETLLPLLTRRLAATRLAGVIRLMAPTWSSLPQRPQLRRSRI
jgi:hypothetical protein